jgi:outer membrane protein assembly factor BamB
LYALNAVTGAKLWGYGVSSVHYTMSSSPAVANGVVYVGSNNGKVYAFGLKKGQEKEGAASKRP